MYVRPSFFQGLNLVSLTESAYMTGIQTGIIAELKLKRIQDINLLYTFQDDYNRFNDMTLEGFINSDFTMNEKNMQSLLQYISIVMSDFAIKEKILIEAYDKLHNELK